MLKQITFNSLNSHFIHCIKGEGRQTYYTSNLSTARSFREKTESYECQHINISLFFHNF